MIFNVVIFQLIQVAFFNLFWIPDYIYFLLNYNLSQDSHTELREGHIPCRFCSFTKNVSKIMSEEVAELESYLHTYDQQYEHLVCYHCNLLWGQCHCKKCGNVMYFEDYCTKCHITRPENNLKVESDWAAFLNDLTLWRSCYNESMCGYSICSDCYGTQVFSDVHSPFYPLEEFHYGCDMHHKMRKRVFIATKEPKKSKLAKWLFNAVKDKLDGTKSKEDWEHHDHCLCDQLWTQDHKNIRALMESLITLPSDLSDCKTYVSASDKKGCLISYYKSVGFDESKSDNIMDWIRTRDSRTPRLEINDLLGILRSTKFSPDVIFHILDAGLLEFGEAAHKILLSVSSNISKLDDKEKLLVQSLCLLLLRKHGKRNFNIAREVKKVFDFTNEEFKKYSTADFLHAVHPMTKPVKSECLTLLQGPKYETKYHVRCEEKGVVHLTLCAACAEGFKDKSKSSGRRIENDNQVTQAIRVPSEIDGSIEMAVINPIAVQGYRIEDVENGQPEDVKKEDKSSEPTSQWWLRGNPVTKDEQKSRESTRKSRSYLKEMLFALYRKLKREPLIREEAKEDSRLSMALSAWKLRQDHKTDIGTYLTITSCQTNYYYLT